MSSVVGIGACVMDTLVHVPSYPTEDTKLRALDSRPAGGGPVATGLVATAKLGVSAAYVGVLSGDSAGAFLKEDFTRYGVNADAINVQDGYRSFTSTVWLSAATGSRTCVFDKGNLPSLRLTEKQKQVVSAARVLMVDGNELDAAIEAAHIIHEADGKVLYDAGGLYEGVERLLPLADILIPSEEFACGHTGCKTVEEAAKKLYTDYQPEVVVITCGKRGGIWYDGNTVTAYPAYPVQVVDSNGAGDVFHGAFAAGVIKGYSYETCCHFASAVSALKCTGIGARNSVPDFETAKAFLKENGYDL